MHLMLRIDAIFTLFSTFFLQDPKLYVSTILDVHRKYNALVMTAFNNDSGFVASLDKACGKVSFFTKFHVIFTKF